MISSIKPAQWAVLIVILAIGVFLRVYPSAGFTGVGFDENLYRNYVSVLDHFGLSSFPELSEAYLQEQKTAPLVELPPTRALYIVAAWAVVKTTGVSPLAALHFVSCAFSILMLGLATVVAWRMKGVTFMVGVSAFMACAPTQIHMGQHALIDGFFAFWAVLAFWTLWECMQAPESWRWLLAHALAFAAMVLTKENAFFAAIGLWALMASNWWFHFGTVRRNLLVAQIIGGLLGLAILINLAGGVNSFVAIYQSLISKAQVMQYSIKTGDGPWYRYFVDWMIMSPLVLILTIGAVFQLPRSERALWFGLIFVAATYLPMCNVRYGMNLRYTNMWDLPMRMLALQQLVWLSNRLGAYRATALWFSVGALSLLELRQYWIFFAHFGLYELVTEGLLRAVNILK